MLIIAKTLLPEQSRFYLALARVFGLGHAQGLAVAEAAGVSHEARVADVRPQHVRRAVALVQERHVVGDELRRAVRDDILRLIEARTRRGQRHTLGLPVRGQRTHTNAETAAKFRRHIEYDVK